MKAIWALFSVPLLAMLLIMVAWPASMQAVPNGDLSLPRKSTEAGITVTATYLGGSAFSVKLDTHTGVLDYQMDKLAYVRTDDGNVYRPTSWDGISGGHHVEGTLQFPAFDDNQQFDLVIDDVGVKERVLRW
jgi:hypothetical protein